MNIEWIKGLDDRLWHKAKEQGTSYGATDYIECACGVHETPSMVSFEGDQGSPGFPENDELVCFHCQAIEVEA